MIISNTIEIKCKPEKVFYWLGDPSRAMVWMTSVTKTGVIKETPNMVGSTFCEYVEEDGHGPADYGSPYDYTPDGNHGR